MSFKTLAARIDYQGGNRLGRINKQKLYSFHAALKADYNSRTIITPLGQAKQCLINTNNLKPDYDKKIISVDFDAELESGDVFEVLDDGTHWMVYLPILTETAYLRSEIIRCRYILNVDGEDYWIYFQGPTETDLRWFIKNGVNFNELNLSGTVYIKNTPTTKAFFSRFKHIKLDGHTWEVQVTDSITVPGIIELEVQEYYDNVYEEYPEVVKVDCQAQIAGREVVQQDHQYGYEIDPKFYHEDWTWSIEGNDRVRIVDTFANGRSCLVKVEQGAIKTYQVVYGNGKQKYKIDVLIDYLPYELKGKQEVYPYDTITYTSDIEGQFWLETNLAKIVKQNKYECIIEIITGKKGNFTLFFKANSNGQIYQLPITIKSL